MGLGSVGASGPPQMIQPFLLLAGLRRGPRSFRAGASGLARGSAALRSPPVILLLPRALALRLVALRLGQQDGQFAQDDRVGSRLWQIHDHAASTHGRVFIRHSGRNGTMSHRSVD